MSPGHPPGVPRHRLLTDSTARDMRLLVGRGYISFYISGPSREQQSTNTPHSTALHRDCTFYKLKVCGNPAGNVFPAAFSHFMSVLHFGIPHGISNFFNIIMLYLLLYLWSVIFDVTIIAVLAFFSNKAFLTKSCALFSQIQCSCTLNRIQYTHNFYKNWDTNNPMTCCTQCSLYCSCLELNPQCLQGVPVHGTDTPEILVEGKIHAIIAYVTKLHTAL